MNRSEQSEQRFSIRGWQIHNNNIAYAEEIIRRAPEYGINHIQFSHHLCHHAHQVLGDATKAKEFNRLARLAHERDIEVYIWTHELERVPKELRDSEGRVDLEDSSLWDWLKDKYTRLFTMIPEIDGIILTFHETGVPVYKDHRVNSNDPPPERIRKLIDALQHVLGPMGKKIYARTFVRQVDELEWLVEGIQSTNRAVRVMTKVEARDWHQYRQENPAMGRFPERIQIAELDPAAEYYGKGVIPFYFPDDIKADLDRARRLGAAGAVARIDRLGYHAFGSANEPGVIVFSRLVNDPSLAVSEIEKDYFCGKYGNEACEAVLRAFRRTREIIPGFYLVKRFYFLNNHSEVPSPGYAVSHILSHSPVRWDPSLAPIEEKILEPDEAFYLEVMEEKESALQLAEESLADVESASAALEAGDYAQLKDWFGRESRCASLWLHLTSAFFRWRLWERNPTEEAKMQMQGAFEQLADYADELERTVGPDEEFASAVKTRKFLEDLRNAVSKSE